MLPVEQFRHLSLVFSTVERVASYPPFQRSRSLTFHDADGKPVGMLVLDGAMVCVGVHVHGVPYVDDIFLKESLQYGEILQKVLQRIQLSEKESNLLARVPLLVRRNLRAVTARAIQKIASLCDLSQLGIKEKDLRDSLPLQGSAVDFSFSPVELMLSAGRSGNIRYTDIAARMYETLPEPEIERWLFEWQPADPDCPWPVMTTRLGERTTGTVALFGQLGQSLARHISLTRRRKESRGLSASLMRTHEHIYFLVGTERYLALLVYPAAQIGHVLKLLEGLVASADGIRAQSRPPAPLSAPAQPAIVASAGSLAAAKKPAQAEFAAAMAPRPSTPSALGATAETPAAATAVFAPSAPSSPSAPELLPASAEAAEWIAAAAEPLLPAEASPLAAPPPQKPAESDAPTPMSAPLVGAAEPAALIAPQQVPLPKYQKPDFADPVLVLRQFSARVGERTVLKEINLALGRRGVYTLMGPGGSGKSALAGILSGRNRGASGWFFSGDILYDREPLGLAARPAVVGQKLNFPAVSLRTYLLCDLDDGAAFAFPREELSALLEQLQLARLAPHLDETLGSANCKLSLGEWWRLAIGRELLSHPPLLCVDEPTVGLDDAAAEAVLELLKKEGTQRTVLFVTHNQQHARRCSDYVILLAGGAVWEYQPAAVFFAHPQSTPAKDFIRTGSCSVPFPDARPEHLEPDAVPLAEPAPLELAPLPSPAASRPTHAEADLEADDTVVWPHPQPILSLHGFGLSMGGRDLLSRINLQIAARGIYVLVAQNGGEKRLFMRALCGPHPSGFLLRGQALYLGKTLAVGLGPATPAIDARLTMMSVAEYLTSNHPSRDTLSRADLRVQAEQAVARAMMPELATRFDVPMHSIDMLERRVLEILRATAADPALLVLDDPLNGLGPLDKERLLQLLRAQSEQRALLILTSHLATNAELGGQVAWLYQGQVRLSVPAAPLAETAALVATESTASSDAAPRSEPLPTDQQAMELPHEPPSAAPEESRVGQGPRGFQWLRRGALAGMPAPGMASDIGYDLDLIRQAGVSHLVSLTTQPLAGDVLRKHGLSGIHFPVKDMDAPRSEQAAELADRIAGLLAEGAVIGFHCKAGLGRTGTMLAAQLVWEGDAAEAALKKVRVIDPNWVQSEKQEQFLARYEQWLRTNRPFVDGTKQRRPRPGGPAPRK